MTAASRRFINGPVRIMNQLAREFHHVQASHEAQRAYMRTTKSVLSDNKSLEQIVRERMQDRIC